MPDMQVLRGKLSDTLQKRAFLILRNSLFIVRERFDVLLLLFWFGLYSSTLYESTAMCSTVITDIIVSIVKVENKQMRITVSYAKLV